MSEPVATVFKYCNVHGLEILTKLEVKVTPPNEFNDPFEFMANIACSDPLQWAYRYFNEDRVRELHTSGLLEGRFTDSFPKFLKRFKANRQEFIKGWVTHVWPNAIQDTQTNVLDDISECLGVLCLSRKETSILMWGHYCDSHRGMVIGFDDSNEIFKREWGLRRVNYEEKRIRETIQISPMYIGFNAGIEVWVVCKEGVCSFKFRQKRVAHVYLGLRIPCVRFCGFDLSQRLIDDLERHA